MAVAVHARVLEHLAAVLEDPAAGLGDVVDADRDVGEAGLVHRPFPEGEGAAPEPAKWSSSSTNPSIRR